MATFFAVCNVNGPISRKINAETVAEAVDIFGSSNHRDWIDSASTDAEDDLDICGEGMDEAECQRAPKLGHL